VTIVTQAKERLYHDWHLVDVCILLATKVFGCLHQYVDDIFHRCANMVWLAKGIEFFSFVGFTHIL
jgi:hypothetical protein